MKNVQPDVLVTLADILPAAQKQGYAVGGFAARLTPWVLAILRAAEKARSPVIIQAAQVEFEWFHSTPEELAADLRRAQEEIRPTFPIVLHLDHTQDFNLFERAIAAGFTSVMIDASHLPLRENIATVQRVVDYAHARRVSVEAELGRIASADGLESAADEEFYTDPSEAEKFVRETGIDALAVSVGTYHGISRVREQKIDLARLRALRAVTPIPLVLHGGSGVPRPMLRAAIELPEGGVSKVNIATELEQAALQTLGRDKRLTHREFLDLPPAQQAAALEAVEAVVLDKMTRFLGSSGKAV